MLTAGADGGGDLLEPLDLKADGPVVPDLVGEAEGAEEGGVHGGGAGDGHVGALLEVGGGGLGGREEGEAEPAAEEVHDDAAVAAPAGGASEVGLAVGGLREGDRRRPPVRAQVARVRDRVAEAVHRIVLLRHRRQEQRRAQRHQQQQLALHREEGGKRAAVEGGGEWPLLHRSAGRAKSREQSTLNE